MKKEKYFLPSPFLSFSPYFQVPTTIPFSFLQSTFSLTQNLKYKKKINKVHF